MEITLDFRKFWREMSGIVVSKNKFLKKNDEEVSISETFFYHASTTFLGVILATLFYHILIPFLNSKFSNTYLESLVPVSFIKNLPFIGFSFALAMFLGFVWSAVFMFWLRLFKIKISFTESYKSFTFARTSLFLFRWLPYLNILSMVQSTVYVYFCLVETYKVRKPKAITVVILGLSLIILAAYTIVVTYQRT